MKLVVVGVGQCGGRVADEFARLNKRARSRRSIEIIVDTFAVNTDSADLSGLLTISPDYQHRILIGAGATHGHGVAKMSEVGAQLAKEDGDKIIDAVRAPKQLYEADAFLLVAGAAGGTGSGATPVMAKMLKERFDKPVYALIVLPFEHEEMNEERAVFNTAVCLKSIYSIADAVILVDNQRYVRKDFSLQNNIVEINQSIVEPFFNLLCAGEEKKPKNIGARLLDAGDIMQTLYGWTVIGYGKSLLPLITLPIDFSRNYRKRTTRTNKGIEAMDEALSELSVSCNTNEAYRALYLLSAPAKEMNMDLVKELGDHLKGVAPQAVLRGGDYPREKGAIDVTVILSEFCDMEKVKELYGRSSSLTKQYAERQKAKTSKSYLTEEAGKDVPSLL